jgi:tripartite-type tricarboxylate transporter receptor subunit TctC
MRTFPFATTRRSLLRSAALAGAGTVLRATAAQAETFPERPISIVVGFAAGGGTDIVARDAAQRLEKRLRQPVIIENRPGAGGTLAAQFVANAAPNGYTLLLGTGAVFSIAPLLYRKLPYNTETAFVPLAGLASNSQVILVKEALPIHTPQELVAYLRQHPDKLLFGSAGNGSTTHLSGVQFAQRVGVGMTHVPYRGLGPALIDLAAGNIDMIFDGVPPHVGGNLPPNVRAIATTDTMRAPGFPDLPTLAESVLPDFAASTWYGLFAPAATPAPIRDTLIQAINEVLADADYRSAMETRGYRVLAETPAQLSAQIKAELAANAELIKAAGVTIQ